MILIYKAQLLSKLTAFPRVKQSDALKMLGDDPEHLYVLQAGVSGDADEPTPVIRIISSPEDSQVSVMLRARDANGSIFEKVFTFFGINISST